jgi:excinuclease ABC subunit A
VGEPSQGGPHTVLHGKDHKVVVQYKNRFGRERKYSTGFEGAIQYVHRKHTETDSDWARDRYEEYMRQIPAPRATAPA